MRLLDPIFNHLEKYTLPTDVIQLESSKPIAQGRSRLVYAHPENSAMLIKLQILHRSNGPSFRAFRRKIRPSGSYKAYIKEIIEYRRLDHRFEKVRLPIPAIHGLIRTSRGLGLLVDAVKDESGDGLAPTLAALTAAGTAPSALISSLEELWKNLYELRPSIGDLHPGNIVLGRYKGRRGLFVIDGLGRSVVFPIDAWFRRENHRRLQIAYANLLEELA